MTRRATAAELRAQAASMFVDDTNLLKTLDNLGGREFGRVIRSATGNAMNPVVSQARKNLKGHRLQGSGLLRKSLGKKNKTYKRAALQVALVGARTGFKQVVTRRSRWGVRSVVSNPVNYAHLLLAFRHCRRIPTPSSVFRRAMTRG